jgi:hypothetical protein
MSRHYGARKALLAGLVAVGLTSTVFAQTSTPATGLGQSWPNAVDLSASPNWHVYVFVLNGIEYVQVNDLNGTVHAAVAAANGTTIVLPVGVDAGNVTVATSSNSTSTSTSTSSTSTSTSTVVYSDAATTITATPLSSGATQFTAAQTCGTAYSCTGGNVVASPSD